MSSGACAAVSPSSRASRLCPSSMRVSSSAAEAAGCFCEFRFRDHAVTIIISHETLPRLNLHQVRFVRRYHKLMQTVQNYIFSLLCINLSSVNHLVTTWSPPANHLETCYSCSNTAIYIYIWTDAAFQPWNDASGWIAAAVRPSVRPSILPTS